MLTATSTLSSYASAHSLAPLPPAPEAKPPETAAISLRDVWFQYGSGLPEVIKGLSLMVGRGELIALLGGNGTGKSTALSLIDGSRKPCRGKVSLCGRVGTLPQNPQALFVKKTVRDDLFEVLSDLPLEQATREQQVSRVAQLCRLGELLDRHPYDLSGGEQQRAALAKVLLANPEILLMDEPTKGLDAEFKQIFAAIVKALQRRGTAVVMVSHDVEFCAEYADRCALFFDGTVVSSGAPRAFFSGNSFYTTSANRMARDILPEAVTAADVIAACGGTVPPAQKTDEGISPPPIVSMPGADRQVPPLPLWRRLLAAAAGAAACVSFKQVIDSVPLSALINGSGLAAPSAGSLATGGVLTAALFVFLLAVSRRGPSSVQPESAPRQARALPPRTAAAAGAILLLIPLTIFIGVFFLDSRKYSFIALLILLEAMLPFALAFEGRMPQPRELVVIAVLCAIGVAGRAAFFMLPQFKPVMSIVIIADVAFGGETGFLVGAVTMLTSNILFGQGPWTPWQMFAMGLTGFLAGTLYQKGVLRRARGSLCVYGALAAVFIYGLLMDPSSALLWSSGWNWKIILAYSITGLPMNLVQAAANVLFLWLLAEPMLDKLERIKVKYGLEL